MGQREISRLHGILIADVKSRTAISDTNNRVDSLEGRINSINANIEVLREDISHIVGMPLLVATDDEMDNLMFQDNNGKIVMFIGISNRFDSNRYYLIEDSKFVGLSRAVVEYSDNNDTNDDYYQDYDHPYDDNSDIVEPPTGDGEDNEY